MEKLMKARLWVSNGTSIFPILKKFFRDTQTFKKIFPREPPSYQEDGAQAKAS
jgi:hypothetical protein